MRDIGKWILGFFGILVASFLLVMIMSWGSAGGIPPVETGMALAIVIGGVMIHRLTEAVSRIGAIQVRDTNVERLDILRN